MPCVYMVQCRDNTLYTGWTTDLSRRLAAHNAGRGARYTQSRRPVKLVYSKTLPDRRSAMQHERALKQLTRAQ
ncbi:MAG: GIY-YIG nuclease family protein, partial [Anaerolineae bacterium]